MEKKNIVLQLSEEQFTELLVAISYKDQQVNNGKNHFEKDSDMFKSMLHESKILNEVYKQLERNKF